LEAITRKRESTIMTSATEQRFQGIDVTYEAGADRSGSARLKRDNSSGLPPLMPLWLTKMLDLLDSRNYAAVRSQR
jgi:hypothetical protein